MDKEIKKILHLHMFDNTNVTTQTGEGQDLSVEMKTYYSKYLIANAKPCLYHDQFGQKHPIPKNGGKTIEFRRFSALPKALTPLTEGVTPSGRRLNVSKVESTIKQYGDYVELSDMLLLTAIDNNLTHATELLGTQAGMTSDTITRAVSYTHLDVYKRQDEHFVNSVTSLRIKELWLACDTDGSLPAFKRACEKLRKAGFSRDKIKCYALSYGKDMEADEARCRAIWEAGAMPFMQLYRDFSEEKTEYSTEWNKFARQWQRPAAINAHMKLSLIHI